MKRWLILCASILTTVQVAGMMRQKERRGAFSLSEEEKETHLSNLFNRRAETLQLSNEEKDELNNLATNEKKHEFLKKKAERISLAKAAAVQQDNNTEN